MRRHLFQQATHALESTQHFDGAFEVTQLTDFPWVEVRAGNLP